ncbi:TIGR03546 family protein [Candidatus Ruminimicrobiellum ovillum]|uniref:TIGR03546 family protein n=1 Tax=Candidatus Ruminimicrobiellum ovillum TaxID=1947927 RepID=UPI00355A21A7
MFFLKLLKQIIVIFQTDISPNQVAWGFALGAILGLVPNMFMKLVLFIVIMMFRVNISAAFLAWAVYEILSFALDPLFDSLGYYILNINSLNGFYTYLYNLPVVPFTKFNNTVVMGSLVVGIILIIPNMIIAKKLLVYYRTHLREKVSKWKIVKILSAAILSANVVKIVK